MNRSIKLIAIAAVLFSVSAGQGLADDQSKRTNPAAKVSELKKQVNRANTKHKLRKTKQVKGKQKRELVKRYKSLNKRLMSAGDTVPATGYIVRYARLNDDLNAFANGPGGAEGGIASCMGACDDEYPGVGGGAGVNRAACKIGCLVHGGDDS
ncbi:hypothetical protein GCM10008090_29560 [Arenicella chitinivorans]|uniref:Uncharacterized protein n=1 Tax=Arenicella chitinivorans TaxID=1329800 RepID=A0A918S0S8_9GAMM|nr:hypothetical protein [Arenicella chitinivorans]GHA17923.1 hypothetical protein GCM10008090_29560 [Arenicella chitinivorans]